MALSGIVILSTPKGSAISEGGVRNVTLKAARYRGTTPPEV